jgi:hypothetical protein
MIEMEKDLYKKEDPPLDQQSHKTNVTVDVKLISLDFDEKAQEMKAKIWIRLQWYVNKILEPNLRS